MRCILRRRRCVLSGPGRLAAGISSHHRNAHHTCSVGTHASARCFRFTNTDVEIWNGLYCTRAMRATKLLRSCSVQNLKSLALVPCDSDLSPPNFSLQPTSGRTLARAESEICRVYRRRSSGVGTFACATLRNKLETSDPVDDLGLLETSARLGAVKVREVIRMLEDDGWQLVRSRGSHRQFRQPLGTLGSIRSKLL